MTAAGGTQSSDALVKPAALGIHRTMVRVRAFEERIHALKGQGELEGFIHLTNGQEAVDVGVCASLEPGDSVFTSFRNHGQALARGMDMRAMMAEMFGRATGCNAGKGGSMHIADHARSFFGGNGIVGSAPPLALGPALTAKLRGTSNVSVCFFGDGAMQQGVVHESMNLAAIWKLPVIFVCTNNNYAQSTRVSYNSAVEDLASRAAAYDFTGVTVDGQSVIDVHEAALAAASRARGGEGPTLIEAATSLFLGAWEGEHPSSKTYRDPDRDAKFLARDPIAIFSTHIVARGWATDEDVLKVHADAMAEVDGAVAYARSSPWPTIEDGRSGVYASVAG